VRRKIFRREIIFPMLGVAFICASAQASPSDELAGQAAVDLHCGSVSIVRANETQFLATGCGQDRIYTCDDDGACMANASAKVTRAAADPNADADDDEAAEAVASVITDMACACASAGLASHGSHSHGSHSSSSHKRD
jgi:hypothetical protein